MAHSPSPAPARTGCHKREAQSRRRGVDPTAPNALVVATVMLAPVSRDAPRVAGKAARQRSAETETQVSYAFADMTERSSQTGGTSCTR